MGTRFLSPAWLQRVERLDASEFAIDESFNPSLGESPSADELLRMIDGVLPRNSINQSQGLTVAQYQNLQGLSDAEMSGADGQGGLPLMEPYLDERGVPRFADATRVPESTYIRSMRDQALNEISDGKPAWQNGINYALGGVATYGVWAESGWNITTNLLSHGFEAADSAGVSFAKFNLAETVWDKAVSLGDTAGYALEAGLSAAPFGYAARASTRMFLGRLFGAGEVTSSTTLSGNVVIESIVARKVLVTPNGVRIDFPVPSSLTNIETRQWYDPLDKRISEFLDQKVNLQEQAHQAWRLRDSFKTAARDAMSDQKARAILDSTRPNQTWEQTVKKYSPSYGGDDLWRAIIQAAQRPNAEVGRKFGVPD